MAMTREEQDAFDRKMAGINTPGAYGEGMAALDRAVGNPIASYSLDDLRRMFLRGSAVPAATSGEMPAQTDALPGLAPPGPVTVAPLPPPAPPAAMPTGTRPSAPVMPPPPAPPVAYRMDPRAAAELTAAGAPMAPTMAPMQAEPPPGEASTAGARLTPQQMAAALRRFGRMELDPNSFAARFARTQR